MSGTLMVFFPETLEPFPIRYEGKGEPPLHVLQMVVGGYIELIRVIDPEGNSRRCYVNEDGIRLGLKRNAVISDVYGLPILGNAAIWIPDAKKRRAK